MGNIRHQKIPKRKMCVLKIQKQGILHKLRNSKNKKSNKKKTFKSLKKLSKKIKLTKLTPPKFAMLHFPFNFRDNILGLF